MAMQNQALTRTLQTENTTVADPVERVARAIHAKSDNPDNNQHWFHEDASKCELSRQLARAAIAAMPGEPVAWQYFMSGTWGNTDTPPTPQELAAHPERFRPLYAAPAMPGSEPGMGWQPISTAPKDGTVVLVYVPRRMGALYMAAANITGVQWWSRNLGAIVPSHWQPLPAPPEVQP